MIFNISGPHERIRAAAGVRAGIVEKANHYLQSSASIYSSGKGLIDIEIAENPVIDVLGKNEFWKYNNYEKQIFKLLKVGRLCAAEFWKYTNYEEQISESLRVGETLRSMVK